MLRKTLIMILLVTLCLFYINGCDTETEEEVVVKTAAEYEAEAEKQITEENIEDELKKLEETIDKEMSEEP